MATKILLKKSNTGGSAPLTGDLDQGELAINLVDRKIYTKNGSGAIVTVNGAYVDSVAPASPAEGDIWYDTGTNYLKAYNGSAWVNAGFTTLGEFGITATATELNYVDGVTSNIQTQLDGKASSTHNHTLDSLSNVTITGNTAGELLKWNGTAWVNNTISEAGFATVATTGSYTDLSNTPTIGNGTQTITAGTGIAGGGSFTANQTGNTSVTITLDLNELATSTADADGDYFAVVDAGGLQKKLTKGSIKLSGFDNDIGFITGYTETDTLQSVTGRGNTTTTAIDINNATASTSTTTGALTVDGGVGIGGNLNVGGNTIIAGNLTVNGTTTSVNSNEVNIGDSVIVLNSDETGTPSQNAGFEVERGTSPNVAFVWNESDDAWDMGNYNLQNVVIDGGTY